MVEFAFSPKLKSLGIVHGFCQRQGGISPAPFASLNVKVSELVPDKVRNTVVNQRRAYKALGLEHKSIVMLQLRGRHATAVIDSTGGGRTMLDIDGAATSVPDTALCLTVADCLPVLLADKTAGVIGVAHAGWQGAAGKVSSRVIELMSGLGARPRQIVAAIGPSICGRCYEVKDDVSSKFEPTFINRKGGKQYLDLWAAVESELKNAGVNRIDNVGICTYENTDKYFSARRESVTGRHLAAISL